MIKRNANPLSHILPKKVANILIQGRFKMECRAAQKAPGPIIYFTKQSKTFKKIIFNYIK